MIGTKVNQNARSEPRIDSKRPRLARTRECGWKHGDSGHSAGETNFVQRKNETIHLTPTGLLMEGHYTQNTQPRSMSVTAI
jgi:hypothetical protein